MIRHIVWLPAIGLLLAAISPARADDKDNLQGAWKVEKAVEDGEELPAKVRQKLRVEFKGVKMLIREDAQVDSNDFTVDPTTSPKAINVKPNRKDEKPILAIYELAGDNLKLCIPRQGRKRPTEFASTKESGNLLLILTRETK